MYLKALRKEIRNTIDLRTEPGKQILILPCEGDCGRVIEFEMTSNFPPEIVRKKLNNKGWDIGRKLICPGCKLRHPHGQKRIIYGAPDKDELPPPLPGTSTSRTALAHALAQTPIVVEAEVELAKSLETQVEVWKTKRQSERKQGDKVTAGPRKKETRVLVPQKPKPPPREPTPGPTPQLHLKTTEQKEEAMPPANPEAASEEMRKAHRAVMGALEDCFDEDSGRWRKPEYSDKYIADQTKASEDYVRQQRELYFGKLKEPEELQLVREKLVKIETQIIGIERDAKAAVDMLTGEVGKVKSELAELVRKNKW